LGNGRFFSGSGVNSTYGKGEEMICKICGIKKKGVAIEQEKG